jgi:uncharacterized RDD family membrane protein YckC
MCTEEPLHEGTNASESESGNIKVRTSRKKASNGKIDFAGIVLALTGFLLVIVFLGLSAKFLGFAVFSIIFGLSYYFSTRNYKYAIAWIAAGFIILLCHIGNQLL